MYTLDTQAAKQADQSGKFIKETGKYKGRFIKAEALTATTGTQGIAFTFESDEKQTANITIYTVKSNGEKLYDFQKLMAIMACMKLRTVSDPVIGKATKYDFDAKQDVQYDAPLLLDLMNKPIGLLLQSCEYEKQKDRVPTGEYGWKLEINGAFEASTELTASEILGGKTKPELLASMVAHLSDRPLKNKGAGSPRVAPQSSGGPSSDMDDDIPFLPAAFGKAWAI
jgi:hypothetical protein